MGVTFCSCLDGATNMVDGVEPLVRFSTLGVLLACIHGASSSFDRNRTHAVLLPLF